MSEENRDDPTETVLMVVGREREAVEGGDISRYLGLLAEDALFMPPGDTSKGGSELESWLRGFLEDFSVQWLRFDSTECVVGGDLAYHAFSYLWRVTPRRGGNPMTSAGKGVHLLRKEPDGSWKIAREIWNADPAGETASAL